MRTRVLFIDAGGRRSWVEELDGEILGPVDVGIKLHLERYKSYEVNAYSERNVLVFGMGRFAGSALFGSHRLVFAFKSPLTGGFHVAAMGGAAYVFKGVGVDAVCIEGKSADPVIITIWGKADGSVEVKFHEISLNELTKVYSEYKGARGVYALTKYLIDKFPELFEKGARALVVGPAALSTSMGAIFSCVVKKGEIEKGSEDWAARGGGGSVMYRAHGVVAIVYGGEAKRVFPGEDLSSREVIDKIFKEVFNKPYGQVATEATVKYRYNPKVGSGGTFGSNYPHLGVITPMFNWRMIYLPKELREKLHGLIMKYYWEPFNEECIKPKTWKTCGEPCPAVCKKYRLGYKVDYEPYEGAGPMCGVFELHAADKVVEAIDELGFDAIEFGNVAAWILELLHRGLLKPEEVGVSAVPYFDPENYKVEYSEHNAKILRELAEALAYGKTEILRKIGEGLRRAAKWLDEVYRDRVEKVGVKFEDLAVYAPYGKDGHITPNFYWTPGMVAPLAVLGRYWTKYSGLFDEPEKFAEESLGRAVKELYSDDGGFCRFHRKWVEKIASVLYERGYNLKIDLVEHYKKTYAKILEYNVKAGAKPVFWDSERTIDYLMRGAVEAGFEEWVKKFEQDKVAAAKEWWERFAKKVEEFTGVKFVEA